MQDLPMLEPTEHLPPDNQCALAAMRQQHQQQAQQSAFEFAVPQLPARLQGQQCPPNQPPPDDSSIASLPPPPPPPPPPPALPLHKPGTKDEVQGALVDGPEDKENLDLSQSQSQGRSSGSREEQPHVMTQPAADGEKGSSGSEQQDGRDGGQLAPPLAGHHQQVLDVVHAGARVCLFAAWHRRCILHALGGGF
jgi:hypothetical protein